MRRVNKRNPCPICGRPDWCGISPDGSKCICMRVSDGSVKQTENGGFLHILHDDPNWQARPRVRTVRLEPRKIKRHGLGELASGYGTAIEWSEQQCLANDLGVTPESLNRLRIGLAKEYPAWSFPMHNAQEHVCGIRLRTWTGKKFSVRGGREGLFWPVGLDFSGQLLLCEGPTDLAALLDLGFNAVGRPSCSGGTKLLAKFVRTKAVRDVVIVSDVDPHGAGQRGAESLATHLLPLVPTVRIIQPPDGVKDIRAWKQAGATRQDVLAAIDAAHVQTLRIRRRGA